MKIVIALIAALGALVAAVPAMAGNTPGAVYAISNSPVGNEVLVFDRSAQGELTPAGSYATGGLGSGAGLGSQGAVIVSQNGRRLFAVNAGSNSISSFEITPSGLELLDVEPSGGVLPTSLTNRGNVLYVLNAGTPNSITGFRVGHDGGLTPIAGSTQPTSGAQTGPAQVQFSPDGDVLVVTERTTSQIVSYTVEKGVASAPSVYPSIGVTPFGFAFSKHDEIFVSDAGGQSGASSYEVAPNGVVTPIMGLAPTGQRAACWAVVTKSGKFGYVTNAQTGNVSGFAIGDDGALTLLNADGVTGVTGGNPTDAALSENSRYLFVRVGNQTGISVFRIGGDGSLTPQPGIAGLPSTAAGLAAF